jgi:hypothetical protein
MTTTMTALVIALVRIGVLGLGALELRLFWLLGEYSDRGRRGGTEAHELDRNKLRRPTPYRTPKPSARLRGASPRSPRPSPRASITGVRR